MLGDRLLAANQRLLVVDADLAVADANPVVAAAAVASLDVAGIAAAHSKVDLVELAKLAVVVVART